MSDKTRIFNNTIEGVLDVANEFGFGIIKLPCGEYRITENGVIFRVWDDKNKSWEPACGSLKHGYVDLIVEMINYRNRYDICDVLRESENLGYDWKQVLKNEFHIYLEDKLVFRVWVSKKQKWCKGRNEFGNGFKDLITELNRYHLNNKINKDYINNKEV